MTAPAAARSREFTGAHASSLLAMARRRTAWQKMRQDLRSSLESSWRNGVPPEASALHARWWQLESWLRDLVHLELRARDGQAWSGALATKAHRREQQDQKNAYMASPDAQATLAYMDVFDLCTVIDDNWNLFERMLIDQERWHGRLGELREIRNRIAHCRRPHDDDLARVEQTLRDLEHGTFLAVAHYNRRGSPLPELDDPLVKAWVGRTHETARRLIDHAELQYDTSFRLSFSRRPWATRRSQDEPVSGGAGYLWHASFYMRDRHLRAPGDLWSDSWLDAGRTRELLVHLAIDDPYHVEATFAAVDDPRGVADAIGHCFDALLAVSRPGPAPVDLQDLDNSDRAYDEWGKAAAKLDPRVQVHTVWTTLDETTVPVSIFGTGSLTRQGQITLD